MKKFIPIAPLLLFLCSIAAAEPSWLPLDEIQVGQRGICRTEDAGGRLVEIPLEVLGVTTGATPRGELILVRFDDPERFNEIGIAAGMSGSPVLIDGHLIGALAYAWPFATQPIGGVTPWEHMREIPKLAVGSAVGAGASSRRPDLDLLVAANSGASDVGQRLLSSWIGPARSGPATAVAVAAAGPPGPVWLDEAFSRIGFPLGTAVSAGSSAQTSIASDREALQAGSMIAAVIARGDVGFAAGGTVTAIDGDRLWAFGHPFLSARQLRMPMARARVVEHMPSLMSSFKFFELEEEIGAFELDLQHGIYGQIGAKVELVPLLIRTPLAEHRVEILEEQVLLPLLVSYSTAVVLQSDGVGFGNQRLRLLLSINYGKRRVNLEASFTGLDALGSASAWISAVLGYLESSPFGHPPLKSLELDLTIDQGFAIDEIVDVQPLRRLVQPGQDLDVIVRLRAYRGEIEELHVSIPVPQSIAQGAKLDLVVAEGSAYTSYDLQARPGRPIDAEGELQLLERLRPSHRLVVALELATSGITLPGGTVAAPPSLSMAMNATAPGRSPEVAYHVVGLVEVDRNVPMIGAARIPLKVHSLGDRP